MVSLAIGLVVMLVLSGKVPGMQSTIDLIDPDTTTIYTCETAYDCYTQVSDQLSSSPAKLTCEENVCVEISCTNSDPAVEITCWDKSKITPLTCSNGEWKDSGERCPDKECSTNQQCIVQADTDCDGELESVAGICSRNKCIDPEVPRCASTTIYWNKWKFVIILIAVVLVFSGYVYYEQVLRKKRGP